MGNKKSPVLGIRKMRQKPKILIHEHLDCSLRPRTMMEFWDALGFDNAQIPFPRMLSVPGTMPNKQVELGAGN